MRELFSRMLGRTDVFTMATEMRQMQSLIITDVEKMKVTTRRSTSSDSYYDYRQQAHFS